MFRSPPKITVALILSLMLFGCGQSKPDPKPTTPPNSTVTNPGGKDPAKSTPSTTAGTTDTKPTDVTKPGEGTKPAGETQPVAAGTPSTLSDAAFLGDDVVGIVIAHPRRVTEWEVYKLVRDTEGGIPEEVELQLAQSPLQPESIERLVISIDQTFVNTAAKAAGLETKGADDADMNEVPVPLVIVTLTDADAGEPLKALFGETETIDGETLHTNPLAAIWFSADKKTIVAGQKKNVVKALGIKKAGKPSTAKVLSQLDPKADLSMAFALESQAALLEQAVQAAPIPGLGLVQQIHGLALNVSVTGKPGGKMLEVVATAADEAAAEQMLAIMSSQLDPGKENAKEQLTSLAEVGDENDKATNQLALRMIESATIKQTGTKVTFTVLVPEGYDTLAELVKPAIEKAKEATERTKKRNNFKQIGLAFHNYHDTTSKFPGAGKSSAPDAKVGLSWRVHLLPYLDGAALYGEFKLDEPWDSEHNKALIDQMPEYFKTDGVDEPGKTSVHVFTGPGAPFAKDAVPAIRDFTDGSSNTILVVAAGADKAEIWTKPGGLDFDPKDPIKALGKLTADTFHALFCDGSVRAISKKIDPETLRRLIQSQDGEPIGEF